MVAKEVDDNALGHVVGVSKRTTSGGDELTEVEEPLIQKEIGDRLRQAPG